jgi:IS5 family transposase
MSACGSRVPPVGRPRGSKPYEKGDSAPDRFAPGFGLKGYDTNDFVKEMRGMNVTPHVSQNLRRPGGSAIDRRTTRHAGYEISQRKRKRIEEVFGWMKTVGMLRKSRHRGIFKVGWVFTFAAAAYNLVRMRNLLRRAVQPA